MSTSKALVNPVPANASTDGGNRQRVKSILSSGPMVVGAWVFAIALHVFALTLTYLYIFPFTVRKDVEAAGPTNINLIGDPDGLGLGTNPNAPPGDRKGLIELTNLESASTVQASMQAPAPTRDAPIQAIGAGGDPGGRGPKDGPSVVSAPSGGEGPALGIGQGHGEGDGSGDGDGSGGFFGLPGTVDEEGGNKKQRGARRIVFVVDRSGSMSDTFDAVRKELKRSVGSLMRGQRFHVIFFSQGPPEENPPKKLVNAVPSYKAEFYEFLDQVEPAGGTQPEGAMYRAVQLEPELIYMLTDGLFDASLLVKLREWNSGKDIKISTIAYVSDEGRPLLEQIAREHNGQFRFVSENELP